MIGNQRRGTAHHYAKLDDGKVRLIRAMRQSGASYRDIAGYVDVSYASVFNVVHRIYWAAVKDDPELDAIAKREAAALRLAASPELAGAK